MMSLRKLRRIVELMDSAGRAILEEKKVALELPRTPSQSSDMFGTRGEDIMSIMGV
jgi:hypothetical protein